MRYLTDASNLTAAQLGGFFVGWPSPPSPATHLRLLQSSFRAVVALPDDDEERVVGFVTAISDGVLSAYIPLLEVLPAYRHSGVGTELVRRLLGALDALYMVDVTCDPDVVPFYERLGFVAGTAMMRRQYQRQSGAPLAGA